VDELTLLRALVDDEPIDDADARSQVWRRLCEGEARRPGERRRRIAVAIAAAVVVVVLSTTAFATVRQFIFVKAFAEGKITRTVDGVRFSLTVSRPQLPRSGWENGPHIGGKSHGMLISKSTHGPQGAEVVIFWTAFPRGSEATPCSPLLPAIGRSPGAVAAAVARAPGVHIVKRPSRVTVGGRPARFVMVTVRKDLGCDPGFFFTWRTTLGGAFWTETDVGDTIRMWIVDVGGKLLIFEAETKDSRNRVAQEIRSIVGSIHFE
jgi:hypothetical protein